MGTLQNTPESLSDTLKWPIREMAKFGSIFLVKFSQKTS